MQKLNCLILEDERLAADVLRDYVNDIPGLNLSAVCKDAVEATEILRQQQIDILFVDIHLPKINGIDFVKTLKGNYQVIFTTAYHQYAVEGFNVNAVDYLLKPIEFSRFLEAVNRVFDRMKPATGNEHTNNPNERKYHFFNVDKKQVKVYEDEILFVESLKDYVKIHANNQKLVTKFQIGELENNLDKNSFIRVHKSFIVNTEKITAFSAMELEIGEIRIPIGRSYKESVEERLKK
ncbi:MAG: LytTR family DNA-binding domain-containing protein [Bacteroidota bacterium]|nr:LytTR family DNA-binding domain-containing protein [Bacteroidota bacterium]